MDINVVLVNNHCNIKVSNLEEGWFIRGYYLYKDGVFLKKVVKDYLENEYSFLLEDSGLYFVKVYYKKGEEMKNKNSKVYAFFKEETKRKYQSFLQKNRLKENGKLKLFQPAKPFERFAVILSKHNIKIANVRKKLPWNFTYKKQEKQDYCALIITSRRMEKTDSIFFSGYGIIDNKIIVGNKEANNIESKELNKKEKIQEGIGNFTFLVERESQILIGKDYFGFGRIFYYSTDEHTIIANDYHLLLLVMSGLKIKMELDEEVAIANLAYFKGLLYEQHLSKKMEVKGVYQLPLESYICIEKGKFSLKDTSLRSNLKKDFLIDDYEKLLQEAADEIKQNIATIYQSNRFKNLLVDVTGGVDSRIVFSAVTSMQDEKKKFQIHTFDDKRTKDITVSIPLCNLFSYPYDSVPIKKELKRRKDEEKIARSLNMGIYYYHDYYRNRIYAKNTARLLGGGGEAVARPYYTRYLLKDSIGKIAVEEKFVEELFGRKPDYALLPYQDGIDKCIKTFAEELKTTIGENPLEEFENSYVLLRSAPHFSHERVITEGFLEWNPIYSKKLYFLKIKTYSLFKNSKLAFDLIKYFNPILVGLPYEKEVNNTEYRTIKEQLISKNAKIKPEEIEWNTDDSKWQKANREKEKVTKYKNCKAIKEDREFYMKEIRKAFCFCMKHGSAPLEKALGLPIFHWLENNNVNIADLITFYHKIYSLADQIKLIEESRK